MRSPRPAALRPVLAAAGGMLLLAACGPGMAPAASRAEAGPAATTQAVAPGGTASATPTRAAGSVATEGAPTAEATPSSGDGTPSGSSTPSAPSSPTSSAPDATTSAGPSPTPTRRTPSAHPTGSPSTGPDGPAVTPVNAACGPFQGVVSRAPGSGKTVALTFDDGPDARYTGRILAVLAANGVHATFFDTGSHDAANPGLTAQIVAAGNVLGNHTWDHPMNLNRYSAAFQAEELSRTSAVQQRITGAAPCWFRPPGGAYDATTVALARAAHLSIAMWSVDTEDWQQSAAQSAKATATIVRNARAGLAQQHPLVLMHTAKASHEPEAQVAAERENTIAALPQVIAMYRAAGYRFVTL